MVHSQVKQYVRKWYIRSLMISVFLLVSEPLFGQTANGESVSSLSALDEKVVIAFISSILSLITGYILLQVKRRWDARKRLSYDLEIRDVLGIDKVVAEHIKVTYKGQPSENITFVSCALHNTGNTVVKNQELTFDFGKKVKVLDANLNPTPRREIGVQEVFDDSLGVQEKKFSIKHLEKGQGVNFNFVISGTISGSVHVYPYNEAGDVEVLSGSVSKAQDDSKSLERFIIIFVLFLAIPPIFNTFPGEFSDLASSFAHLLLAAAMVPFLAASARVVSLALKELGHPDTPSLSIGQIYQDEESAAVNIVLGDSSSFTQVTKPVDKQETS